MLKISVFWGWEPLANIWLPTCSKGTIRSRSMIRIRKSSLNCQPRRFGRQNAEGRCAGRIWLSSSARKKCACAPTSTAKTGFSPESLGTILADMGAFSGSTMEMAAEAEKHRLMFLDAPIWGTKEHAANGLLTILSGEIPRDQSLSRSPLPFWPQHHPGRGDW